MPANTAPIFGLTPNIGFIAINTTGANVASNGTGAIGMNMFKAFTAGPNGSFIQRIRFNTVSSTAAVNSVATTLRAYYSTLTTGNTSPNDTALLGEVSVPLISTANSLNATNYYDFTLNFAIPSGKAILVSQHLAQTSNQNWNATVIGSDY